jgi:hypothetical protein
MTKIGLLTILAFIAFPAARAGQTAAEASEIAKNVLSRNDWLSEAGRCPSAVMPERQTLDFLDSNDCMRGQFASCLEKCSAGVGGACYWLGQGLHETGADQAAEVLYQRSCRLGIVSGCTNRAAGMMSEKPEAPSVNACAAETFSKACAFDDPWACTMYAWHLSRGIGVQEDKALALKVLGKSCKYGSDDQACSYGTRLRKELLDASKKKE